jgi:O-antigen/teichoic acid export membrane protein
MFVENLVSRISGILGRDVIVSIVSFFLTTYLANKLGASDFGIWIAALTFLTTCDLFLRLKIDQLIIFYSKYKFSQRQVHKKIACINAFALVIGALVITLLSESILNFFSFGNPLILFLLYISFCISVFGYITYYIFLAEGKYALYNFAVLIQTFSFAIGVLILFQFFEKTVLIVVLAQLSSWIVVILFYCWKMLAVSREQNNNEEASNSYLSTRHIFNNGMPIYLSGMVKGIGDQFPRYFAIYFLSPASVGFVGLAQLIIGLVNRIPFAINTVLYPMLVHDGDEKLTKTLAIIRMMLILFLPIVVALEIFIPSLINVFYGDEFLTVAPYVQVLLPAVYLGLPGLIASSYFASNGEFKTMLLISAPTAAFSLLAMLASKSLIIDYAPIVGIGVSSICGSALSIFIISRRISISKFIPKFDDLLMLRDFFYKGLYKNND